MHYLDLQPAQEHLKTTIVLSSFQPAQETLKLQLYLLASFNYLYYGQ